MTGEQKVWWEQVLSDHAVLLLLRRSNGAACQQLHYLQMVTEKLAKAYLWRSGKAPPKSHACFVSFLKALRSRSKSDLARIAKIMRLNTISQLEAWIDSAMPLAYGLERLAPDLAGDGPNPEYPWPYALPKHSPATFQFSVWSDLMATAQGRNLLRIIDIAIESFPQIC